MKAAAALLLCAMCFLGLDAQCPEPNALKDHEGTKLCARLYSQSNIYYDQSCQGDYLDIYPNDDVPTIPLRWNNRASALVVSRSCSLTVWQHFKKGGTKRKFSAGIQYRLKDVKKGLFGNWDDSISGYYCTC